MVQCGTYGDAYGLIARLMLRGNLRAGQVVDGLFAVPLHEMEEHIPRLWDAFRAVQAAPAYAGPDLLAEFLEAGNRRVGRMGIANSQRVIWETTTGQRP
jgi:hypothetical protein